MWGYLTNSINTMDYYGRIKEVLPIVSGTSERGPWQRQTVVVESFDNPNDYIAIDAIGDRIAKLQNLTIGQAVKVNYSVNSRKGEKGYFTSVWLWDINKL